MSGSRARLVETITEVAEHLSSEHAVAWAQVLSGWRGAADSGLEAALLEASQGYGFAVPSARLAQAWRAAPQESGASVALALLTAAQVVERASGRRAEVVVTGPEVPGEPTRLTPAVLSGLIRSARRELLVVSFAAYNSAPVVGDIAAAASRGVRVDLLLEETTKAHDAFAELRGKARLWHWPANQRGGGGSAKLHAKVMAADRSIALIGSANLTGRALHDNIEVGVMLRAPEPVGRVVRYFDSLMSTSSGALVPWRP
ncbi:DISARM system phospholipase D-like protein DrmC [Marinitenerispora sediminis]|uniref:PLD phosphodiesterase domain-containing protein n=1 Tax=Marinitenerispora sediminis TaxID=1931232 RepID=A0A368TES4_9ACTN|nr:DISARM system phospholipase D-like protein DrmC [Marinitenerispora sediminis]RCV58156.1 hypothetical protein DEF28_00345 [Marinitenerispora sediminis]RCV61447.1 hypothetical protein DEF23_02160 [Marinitenerispora sediminis]RCV62527.1 hypothetical protein DEF24_00695 [Marinitenerispora sediminis]